MKKNFYKGLMTLCFCSVVFTTNVMAQDESPFAGGTGTPDDPYLIATPQQFDRMRDARGASYKLIADLDFSNVHFDYEGGWWPIGEWGSGSGSADRFHGTFDGDGHTIKNFYVEKPTGAHDMTFFGVVEGATIERVIFENITFIGEGRMGMISGQTEKTTIREVGAINCTVKNIGTGVEAGGFVGPGSQVVIYDCYFVDGSIVCDGKLSETDLRGDNAAALVGKAENMTAIMSSYVSGTVVARNNLGGIAGMIDASSSISGCLAITTDNNADQRNGADVTKADLTQEFYEELGFDFDNVWKMDPSISDYPVFKWQKAGSTGVKNIDNDTNYIVSATTDGVKVEGLKGNETICIYDVTGMLLNEQIATQGSMTISLNATGICIVNIVSSDATSTFKVAK